MGRLKDEDRLDAEEEGGGVEEGVRGEERDRVLEDGGPDAREQDPDACLREDGGAWEVLDRS